MANLRDIRKRRRSAASTRKITRTMELVASSKLLKAQQAATASRPFAEGLREMLGGIRAAVGDELRHPLLAARPVKRVLVMVAASDRGLCGAFNINLVARALERRAHHAKSGATCDFIALSKKAAAALLFNDVEPSAKHTGLVGQPRWAKVEPVAQGAIDGFLGGRYDLVEVVYARFISAARQFPDHLTLLPAGAGDLQATPAPGARPQYEFLPDPKTLMDDLIPRTVKAALYSALLQTSAAEHVARRIAMKNATDAAGDMVRILTGTYNRGRQAKITQEIAEIVGAVEAMA